MKRYTVTYTTLISRSVEAECAEDAAAFAHQHLLGKSGKLLGVYPPDYMPESPPSNFTPRPPSAPTPGTPTIKREVLADQIAKAA